ncbi:hypothetical protein WE348_20595 (plasmid) [Alteromonas macleodii]|uniref:hypothetical protein n=1 Tax=Alteromonas macleodii TaxID=28108 RepID=UPI0030CE8087
MPIRSKEFESTRAISTSIQYILKENEGYDVRKIKGLREYIVFFCDEEVGHIDSWGQRFLVSAWGPNPKKRYKNTAESAILFVIDEHKYRDRNFDGDFTMDFESDCYTLNM